VITSVNGKSVSDVNQALNAIAEVIPGKTVPVKVVRKSGELSLDVVVGKRRARPRGDD